MTDLHFRALRSDEAPVYNAFLKNAVTTQAQFFRISPLDIDTCPFAIRDDQHGFTLLAESAAWHGVGTIERELRYEKRAHVAWLVRMYVETSGVGTGRKLLDALITKTRTLPGLTNLNLTVLAENTRAISLYQSLGFKTFAHEHNAVRQGNRLVNELTMSLPLSSAAP
jgi:ribosomal protein S18 acetylase RimI-like enzyme